MICVGYNVAGVPIFDAHNDSKYHAPYTELTGKKLFTIYFVQNCTSHTYFLFYGVNEIYHYKVCSTCGYTVYTKHSFSNGKCTVCGMTQM